MRAKQVNEEVFIADEQVVKVSCRDIEFLKKIAVCSPRKCARLCAHKTIEDKVHEMFIVHAKDAYVRPHKHLNKSESFHVIEGSADIIIFDDVGNIIEVVQMGDYSSGRCFYYRISEPYYHTLLITSELIIFHETTKGPFKREDTIFASWSPEENDTTIKRFMDMIAQNVEKFVRTKGAKKKHFPKL